MVAAYSRLVFAILLFIATLTSLYDWGRYYAAADAFTTLQAIALSLFLFSQASLEREKLKISSKGVISTAIILSMLALVIIWRHLASSLWLDELSQFFFVDLAAYQLSFSTSAATQQQPTLDMYFQLLAQKIFGEGEAVIRFFPGLFFVLAVTQVWDLIKCRTHSIGFSLLGVSLFLSHPNIQYFSLEGRPYILAVFVLTIFLRYLYSLIEKNELSNSDSVGFALSAGVLLSAIGFQPPLIIFSSIVTLFFAQKVCRRSKTFYLMGAYILFAVTLIYWPIVIDSLHIEKVGLSDISTGKSFLSILKAVWVGASGGGYSDFYHYSLVVLSLLALLASLVFRRLKTSVLELVIISGVTILSAASFTYIINWPYFEKFSLLTNILLIIFAMKTLGEVVGKLEAKVKSPSLPYALCAVTAVYFFLTNFMIRSDFSPFERENWRSFSRAVELKKPVGIAPLSLLDQIMPPIFSIYGHKIYFPGDEQIKVFEIEPSNSRARNVLRLKKEMFERPLILAMPKIWSQDDLDPRVVEAFEFGEFNDKEGFRYWYGAQGEQEAVNFIQSLAWTYAGQPWTFSLLETMLVYYASINDQQMVSEVETRLWKLLGAQTENKKLGVKKLEPQQHKDYLQYFSELKDNVH